MRRTGTLMLILSVTAVIGFVLAGSGVAQAQAVGDDIFQVAYFTGGAVSATSPASISGDVEIVNPGTYPGSSLCADIYVFDPREELKECCSCSITPDGLLTLSIFGLTNNPANSIFSGTGVIKIVADAGCNAVSPTPTPELRAWISNPNGGTVTESEFEDVPLSVQELSNLALLCSAVPNQSGPGTCAAVSPACH